MSWSTNIIYGLPLCQYYNIQYANQTSHMYLTWLADLEQGIGLQEDDKRKQKVVYFFR